MAIFIGASSLESFCWGSMTEVWVLAVIIVRVSMHSWSQILLSIYKLIKLIESDPLVCINI